MKIITDEDLTKPDLLLASNAVRKFLRDSCGNQVHAPPRSVIPLGNDTLAITAGSDADNFGFRAYSYRSGLLRDREDQIVACWDQNTHCLRAIAIGERLGAWRTGVLGGIAYQNLAGCDVDTCGVIGTGLQAATQVRAIAALAKPARFAVFSRDPERRSTFASQLERDTGIPSTVMTDREMLVRQSNALIVATNASQTVFELDWLDRCKHITTVGPKTVDRHETPKQIKDWADLIVSDSPQQIEKQEGNHFLAGFNGKLEVKHLGAMLDQDQSHICDKPTLYLSAGLAGTEVALLAALAGETSSSKADPGASAVN